MMHRWLICMLVLGSTFLAGSCQYTLPETPPAQELPNRRDLLQEARRNSTWLLVYADVDSTAALAYHQLLMPLQGQAGRGRTLQVWPASQLPDSLLGAYPTLFFGCQWPEGWRARFSDLPDLRLYDQSIRFGETNLTSGEDNILKLSYIPHPWNYALPAHLITANNEQSLIRYLQDTPIQDARALLWNRWGYEWQQDGQIRMLGNFNDSTWRIDGQLHFEFMPHPELLAESPAVRIWSYDHAPLDEAQALKMLEHIQDRCWRIQHFVGVEELPRLDVYTYPSVEMIGLRRQDMRQAQADPDDMAVHLVSNAYFWGEEWEAVHRPLVRHFLGQPLAPGLETGLSMYWCDRIRGRDWRQWVGRLVAADAIPPLEQVLYPREQDSEPIMALAAGALIDFMLDQWGRDNLLSHYATWAPTPEMIAD
ncbi:MAG: hypothetical protein KDC54_14470, partial [Lewinella sp.]|nr:hypothetical protein [Lewinella sp.]